MTKRFSLVLLAVLAGSLLLQAQQYDVLDKVRADVRKSYGMEGPHRFDEITPLTKAPQGYQPFYISHYGRHGSRYAWSSKTYGLLHDVFTKASELDVLTPFGKEFAARYEEFYKEPMINTGDLVPLGFQQHERIGSYVYDNFPQVFKGDREVDALSSTAQRCIVSMGAFVQGLTKKNGALQVRQASTHTGMAIIAPPSAPKEMLRHFQGEDYVPENLQSPDDFMQTKGYGQGILDKLFTDSSFLRKFSGGKEGFIKQLWAMVSNYHNFESRPLFDDLFSPEDLVNAWEADNYFSFHTDIRQRYAVIPLLEDVIAKADAALENPRQAANLRFGHDYIVEAFATLLNINSCGTIPSSEEEAKYWFQSYNVPKASTLLFVFYKNKKDDVLFKVIWNEQEATLPELKAVSGPYYRWNDFKAWAKDMMEAHPEILPETGREHFVLITDAVPDAILEIRYYSTYNFVGSRIDGYQAPTALLTKEAAESLKAVSDELKAKGYRLKIYDAYRPQRAVDHFVRWSKNPADTVMKRYFYPMLEKPVLFEQDYIMAKSGHTRGSTVDLTLFDMATEKEVDMGGTFDWFGIESHPDYTEGITKEQYENRMILREAMLRHGFKAIDSEWWHFTLENEPFPDTYFNFPVKD